MYYFLDAILSLLTFSCSVLARMSLIEQSKFYSSGSDQQINRENPTIISYTRLEVRRQIRLCTNGFVSRPRPEAALILHPGRK
jgi:hypothetical protein